jgi:hypothetical protein
MIQAHEANKCLCLIFYLRLAGVIWTSVLEPERRRPQGRGCAPAAMSIETTILLWVISQKYDPVGGDAK